MENLSTTPPGRAEPDARPPRYAGFWLRTVAVIIDTVIVLVVIVPLLLLIYGQAYFFKTQLFMGPWDFIINYVFPFIVVIIFWRFRGATPGKMIFGGVIVDAETLCPPSNKQLIGRYFAYLPALLVFGLGILWVAFDRRKQGWHDKLAKTVVIRPVDERSAVGTDEEARPKNQ